MNKMTIKQRLLLLAIALSFMIAAIGALSLYEMKQTVNSLATVYNDRVVPLKQLNTMDDMYSSIIGVHSKLTAGSIDSIAAIATIKEAQKIAHEEWRAYKATYLVEAEKKIIVKLEPKLKKGDADIASLIKVIESGNIDSLSVISREITKAVDPISEEINNLINVQLDVAKQEYDNGINNYKQLFFIVILAAALAILFSIFYVLKQARTLQRLLGCEPAEANNIANQIANGNFNNSIQLKADDNSSLLAALNEMQTSLFKKQDAANRTALSIKTALDAVPMSLRIADKEGNLTYLNQSLISTLKRSLTAWRQKVPDFDADKLLGRSVGVFYDDPQTMLNNFKKLRVQMESDMVFDGRNYKIISTPILNAQGESEGTVGQWVDKTDELRTQKELSELVQAAAAGDLSHRISLEGKAGFYFDLAQNINQMVETTDGVINETVSALERIANGDMTQQIESEYQGAYERIKDNANLTIERLTGIVSEIKAIAHNTNVSATEIAAGNTDLSQRTEEQASSLEETASSMEQMASTVKQNADNARQANMMATEASQVAIKGGQVVSQVVSTMSEINTSSKKIVDIISVIDGIAFQTNILALNAAVEAARAGEQGRGFAVVATEVRNLAQRSAAAAKEIKQLIGDSVDKVAGGTKLVEDAGKTMDEIVTAVKLVTDIVNEIAAASQEQSAGIDQVNNAINNMDEVTQQNAALVEQAAAAAASMEQQTQDLIDSVAVFKLLEQDSSQDNPQDSLQNNSQNSLAASPYRKLNNHAKAITAPKFGAKQARSASSKQPPKEEDWEEF